MVIYTVKGFGLVNKAEIDVFLELSCFFDDPSDVGNLISGSSAFLKSSLNIWEFTFHVFLKPGLENFIQVKKQQLEPDMDPWPDFKLGKEYVKTVYCHPDYLTYMQSTS